MSSTGSLNEAQFLQFMGQMKAKVATPEEIVDALSVFDSSANKDGYVDTSSLKHAMLQMGTFLAACVRSSKICGPFFPAHNQINQRSNQPNTPIRQRTMNAPGDERLSEKECALFMEIADINSDGKIQYRELVKYLTQ